MTFHNLKIYGILTFVSALYGVNYNVLKIVIPDYVGPYGLIVFRVAISTLIFWCFNLFHFERVDWKADGLRIMICAVSGTAANMLLFYKGMGITSAVNGAIIMTLTPVFVLFWAFVLIKEKITQIKMLGIILGLIGAVIILYQPSALINSGDWRGDLLILSNGMIYACYLVIVKPLMKKYKPITVVTWIFTIGLLMVTPVGLSESMQVEFGVLPAKVWWSIGYSILFVTVIVYFLNIWTLTQVEPSVVGAFIYLQPVFATITATFSLRRYS